MIKINDLVINRNHFPDGSLLLKYSTQFQMYDITWLYECDEELVALYYLVNHIRSLDNNKNDINLYLPFIPNSRMDRVKERNEVFTLKYFAKIINDMGFAKVEVLDPHSNVSEALINRIRTIHIGRFIKNNLLDTTTYGNPDYLFFPDEGAMKRYSSLFDIPFVYGQKDRDWKTGEIKGLNIVGEVDKGKSFLIIDDICSRGGTFLHSASKLKELGAGNISLYVSHCENTVLDGELINSGLLKNIFTTNSIFTKSHELIKIIYKF